MINFPAIKLNFTQFYAILNVLMERASRVILVYVHKDSLETDVKYQVREILTSDCYTCTDYNNLNFLSHVCVRWKFLSKWWCMHKTRADCNVWVSPWVYWIFLPRERFVKSINHCNSIITSIWALLRGAHMLLVLWRDAIGLTMRLIFTYRASIPHSVDKQQSQSRDKPNNCWFYCKQTHQAG